MHPAHLQPVLVVAALPPKGHARSPLAPSPTVPLQQGQDGNGLATLVETAGSRA